MSGLEAKRMKLEGRNIICLASAHWDSPAWVNSQHLMSRLAIKNRVLYIEPLSLRFPLGGKPDLGKLFYRLAGWFRKPRKITDNLFVYAPIMIPLHRFRLVRLINRFLLRSMLRAVGRIYRFSDPVLWIFLPTGADLIGRLDEDIVIYHCVDNYSANPGVDREIVEQMERQVLERADLVLATSPSLREKCSGLNSNCHYLPNVADFAHFSLALDPDTAVPSDLNTIPSPRAVFTGNVSGYKVDFELLRYAASELPGISFVLIGLVGAGDPGSDPSVLDEQENIHVMGVRDYLDLPAYLKGCDVGLIPFRINETTTGVFPMKFFEYLAAGKPVVTTGLPALEEYSEHCYIARDRDTFVSLIRKSIEKVNEAMVETGIELAADNSWYSRIEDISTIFQETMEARDSDRALTEGTR
ncbi:MAG: glycosyltransferase [Candidatus Krumholzibacteria bacterium]|nr:glycosyltransferase [Candidatus Krumholzibacteria bacterium]